MKFKLKIPSNIKKKCNTKLWANWRVSLLKYYHHSELQDSIPYLTVTILFLVNHFRPNFSNNTTTVNRKEHKSLVLLVNKVEYSHNLHLFGISNESKTLMPRCLPQNISSLLTCSITSYLDIFPKQITTSTIFILIK